MLRCVKRFFSDETGAVTIEWVVLTAGVIALGIAAYSAFKIDTDNTTAVLLITQDGSRPIMIGGNAISQLIARAKLESMVLSPAFSKLGFCRKTPWGTRLTFVPRITCD